MPTLALPPVPPEDVAGWSTLVADYLEAFGHHVGALVDFGVAQPLSYSHIGSYFGRPCCVVGADAALNEFYAGYGGLTRGSTAFMAALRSKLGSRAIGQWSDGTPTPKLVAVLRGMN